MQISMAGKSYFNLGKVWKCCRELSAWGAEYVACLHYDPFTLTIQLSHTL